MQRERTRAECCISLHRTPSSSPSTAPLLPGVVTSVLAVPRLYPRATTLPLVTSDRSNVEIVIFPQAAAHITLHTTELQRLTWAVLTTAGRWVM